MNVKQLRMWSCDLRHVKSSWSSSWFCCWFLRSVFWLWTWWFWQLSACLPHQAVYFDCNLTRSSYIPHNCCFVRVALASIAEQIQCKLRLLVHKMFFGSPVYITDLLMPTFDISSQLSFYCLATDLVIQIARWKNGKIAFSTAAPHAYNQFHWLNWNSGVRPFLSKDIRRHFHSVSPIT